MKIGIERGVRLEESDKDPEEFMGDSADDGARALAVGFESGGEGDEDRV